MPLIFFANLKKYINIAANKKTGRFSRPKGSVRYSIIYSLDAFREILQDGGISHINRNLNWVRARGQYGLGRTKKR